MGKLMRGFTALCGFGILLFGSALDSTDHFGDIFGGLVFCIVWCILYGLWTQRRRD